MKYLVLWEFSKKQDYIFKSNKLVEAIGASLIIKKLTENFTEYNLKDENFIMKKGGKALYAFDSLKDAKEFNTKFSLDLLENYPGLEVFMVISEFDEVNQDARQVISNIYELLEKKKQQRRNSSYQVSFGIERICESTGLPANEYSLEDETVKYYSKESKVKMRFARNNQENLFKELIPSGYELETIIENLVKDDKKTYMAIVHIDGNAMGKKFKNLEKNIIPNKGENIKDFNERYIKVLKNFSEAVNDAYENAFKFTMNIIEKNKEKLKDITGITEGYFPVRPLILAGDDITYMINGYIGIESAKLLIEYLSKQNLKINGIDLGNLSACAGVALIKKGYPFKKGYDLAEDLCKNAKKILIENKNDHLSVLDFHLAQGEIVGDINYIRNKDYSLPNKKQILNMRPLIVNPNNKQWRNYDNFMETVNRINVVIENDIIGRNKIKELRAAIKKGEKATEHFIKFYSIESGKYLPPVHGVSDYCFNNQDEGRCMYLDAIEVMDLFVKLEQ